MEGDDGWAVREISWRRKEEERMEKGQAHETGSPDKIFFSSVYFHPGFASLLPHFSPFCSPLLLCLPQFLTAQTVLTTFRSVPIHPTNSLSLSIARVNTFSNYILENIEGKLNVEVNKTINSIVKRSKFDVNWSYNKYQSHFSHVLFFPFFIET